MMTPPAALAAWARHRSVVQGPAIDRLAGHGACGEARDWCRPLSLGDAWRTCHRGDWLLWAAARIGVDRRLVVLAACACARTSLHLVPAGEDRPRVAIETAEAWIRGEATIEQVRAAASAAYAAYAAYAAAYATASAAYAAYATASAAYAAYATDAAAYAADAAYAAREQTLVELADIVRGIITLDDVAAAIGGAP